MSTPEERDELVKLIRQALDAARALDDDLSAHLLEMALDEAALSAREARKKEQPSP
ncbi:hypothetical protein [Mesorhizobium sp. CAU 1732]|uniref:hypothetical protein n=1 Tax=Mesorhizobium sp. CAU 1732 TaxID=3140358 RepID=UPI0032611D2F